MKLTPGKFAGMKNVSNNRGVIAAAAMDQRGSLKKGARPNATEERSIEFKIYVTEVLTNTPAPSCSIPSGDYLPRSAAQRARDCCWLTRRPVMTSRRPDACPICWTVVGKRLKEAGADCIKILLYYTPYDEQKINDHKHAWTERIGDECRANDIPFFLELVGYKEGLDEKGPEFAKLKPEVVAKSMEEFSKDRYGVDVLKVEIPVNLQFVEGARSFKGTKAYTKKEALDHYRTAASTTNKPFIYLSAGVSNPEFIEDLEFAAESGVKFNGVLCGRATWKDGIPIYAQKGGKAFEAWLKDEGVKNIQNVNNALKAATPWYSIYEVQESVAAR